MCGCMNVFPAQLGDILVLCVISGNDVVAGI